MSSYPPPPGQQPPGQPPYQPYQPPYMPAGYQPYGGAIPAEHPKGTTILVLGILSLVVCGVLGPFAWSMGSSAMREMEQQPQFYWTNRGNVTAGRICGIIGTCLMGVGLLIFIIAIAAAGMSTR